MALGALEELALSAPPGPGAQAQAQGGPGAAGGAAHPEPAAPQAEAAYAAQLLERRRMLFAAGVALWLDPSDDVVSDVASAAAAGQPPHGPAWRDGLPFMARMHLLGHAAVAEGSSDMVSLMGAVMGGPGNSAQRALNAKSWCARLMWMRGYAFLGAGLMLAERGQLPAGAAVPLAAGVCSMLPALHRPLCMMLSTLWGGLGSFVAVNSFFACTAAGYQPAAVRALGALVAAASPPRPDLVEALAALATMLQRWKLNSVDDGLDEAVVRQLKAAAWTLRPMEPRLFAAPLPTPGQARRNMRACSGPMCVRMFTDSEAEVPLTACARCGVAAYCSDKCRALSWERGHREECEELRAEARRR